MFVVWVPMYEHMGYMISSDGEIRHGVYENSVTIKVDPDGYCQALLRIGERYERFDVHTLVARHFVTGYFPGAEAKHIDGNVQNNAAWNLRWETP